MYQKLKYAVVGRILFIILILVLPTSCQYNLETRFLVDPGSDPTPPTILSTSPARDDHRESLTTVNLTFSEEVVGADSLSNYSLSGTGSGNLSLSSVSDLGGNTFQIALTGSTIDGTIDVNIAGVTDLVGNLMLPDTVSYLGWWDTNWSNRMKLRIDNSAQTENLVDFTALVKLDNSRVDYSVTQGNGQDLRFLDDSRNTLPFETERWDSSGTSSLWMMLPNIPAGSSSEFVWMYYGNPVVGDGQDPSNTWDNDFGAVWHFNSVTGSAGDVLDSSGNSQVADSKNIGPVVSSDIGFGYQFDGNTSWVDPGASDNYYMDPFFKKTVEIRFRAARITGSGEQTLFEEGGSGQGILVGLDESPLSGPVVPSILTATRDSSALADEYTAFSDTSSYHTIVSVFDGRPNVSPNRRLYLYLDGIGSSQDAGYDEVGYHTGNPGIGASPDSDAYRSGVDGSFKGIIDEIRISDVARSPDWIAAQSLSMSDTFITYTEE